jgi:DNA-binding beta-propeller fold protein YncE
MRYEVRDSIVVGRAAGDFFSIDPSNRRLYGAGPLVVDIDQRRVVSALADTTARGGFVLAPELGRGLVRTGIMFKLASGATITKLPAAGDASLYEPVTGRAFLLGDTVAVIDLRSASLTAKISVPGAGESGVADGRGRVYLNMIAKDSIAVLDAKTLEIVAEYSVSPWKSPMGLAIDTKHSRLFAACVGEVVVLDATDGRIVATIPSPGHSDQNAFDPGTGLLFEPGGASGLTIIHEDSPDKYSILQTLIDSRVTSVKVVVDPITHAAYVPRKVDDQFSFVVLAGVR